MEYKARYAHPFPYIGITDFENHDQVKAMVEIFKEASAGKKPRTLMVGVMMSHSTLRGIPTKWAEVWPQKELVGDLFLRELNPFVLNTLHYADFKQRTTHDDLTEAISWADMRGGLHAVQLDMPWPDLKVVGMREFHMILQVGTVAINACDNDRNAVVSKIGEYKDAVEVILLDLSGGKGIPLDAKLLAEYIRDIKNRYDNHFIIAVAGGLGPDTMHLIESIVEEFPDISIDAQGKLRFSGNALDPVDWKLAENYVRKAAAMFE